MNSYQRNDLKKRIFKNDDITAAKIRQSGRRVSKLGANVTEKLTRLHSVVRHFEEDKGEIETRMNDRLKMLRLMKPKAPKLLTADRAKLRGRNVLNTARASNGLGGGLPGMMGPNGLQMGAG